jgi:hypothetical protein
MLIIYLSIGARSGVLSRDTALQGGRSRVRFSIMSLEFFIDIIFRPHFGPGVTQCGTEVTKRNIPWGSRTDNLTTFMCRLSEIWDPQPQGTLRDRYCFTFYLFIYIFNILIFGHKIA